METPSFTRTEFLTSNIKSRLINTYVGKEISKSFQKSLDSELVKKSITNEKSEEINTDLSQSFENIRPSSVNSSIRECKLNKNRPSSSIGTKAVSNIPSSYKSSLKILQERLHNFDESLKNVNSDYLLYSFLIIYTGIWGNNLEKLVPSFVQSKIWNSFRDIIARTEFEKKIASLPRMVRSKKVPQEELKKALVWFCMIKIDELETLRELYDFIRETFIYARKFYFFTILLPEYKYNARYENKIILHNTTQESNKSLVRDRTSLSICNNKIEMQKSNNVKRAFTSKNTKTDNSFLRWGTTFSKFWDNKSESFKENLVSKEKIFKEFKEYCNCALDTEISLFILNKISENLNNKNL